MIEVYKGRTAQSLDLDVCSYNPAFRELIKLSHNVNKLTCAV